MDLAPLYAGVNLASTAPGRNSRPPDGPQATAGTSPRSRLDLVFDQLRPARRCIAHRTPAGRPRRGRCSGRARVAPSARHRDSGATACRRVVAGCCARPGARRAGRCRTRCSRTGTGRCAAGGTSGPPAPRSRPRPVDAALEAAADAEPRRVARGGIAALGRWCRSSVWNASTDAMCARLSSTSSRCSSQALGAVLRREVADRLRQVRRGEQLHRHRRQLGGFGARMTLPDERQSLRGEGVEGMPRLVQQRHDVVHQPDRVHEDERPPAK